MKRRIAMVLAMVMLLVSLPVFAATEDSAKMQEVLLKVKEKITIPVELTEFSGSVSEYNKKISYYFDWTSPDYEKAISVSCDEQGRITSYYQNINKVSDKRLSGIPKAELIAFAESFLRTTIPEAFISETDLLVYDEESYYASGNLSYHLEFVRRKDDVKVKDNYVNVYLSVVDGEIQVRNMELSFDYDAEFSAPQEDVENYQEKYQELFPAELIYRDEYKPVIKENEPHFTPVLVYRIKDDRIGYMSSSTGEVITEDILYEDEKNAPELEDSVGSIGSAGGSGSLTPQEQAELEKLEGLLQIQDVEKTVKKLPYLEFSDKFELKNSNLYKDSFGNYYFWLSYIYEEEDVYQYFNLRVNAKTGEILEISENTGRYEEEKELTKAQTLRAEKNMTEFLNLVAEDKLAETEQTTVQVYGNTVTQRYVRTVNKVPYIDNGIHISFDAVNHMVKSYSLNFGQGEFTDPKKAIGVEEAYEKILEIAPIQPIYIQSGGKYQKAFVLSKSYVSVDAVSGENKNQEVDTNYTYNDIAGHWVEEAANGLSEIQVGLSGGKLNPETAISQVDFLRLLASAVMGKHYVNYSEEELYDVLMRNEYITQEEIAPESQIKREDAFVYVIRMAGYEKIAKLTEIYRVTYGDQAELSPDKIGYAAILSGFGVICGDGGNLRPQDALTRAEAMVMTYKYLLSL